MPAALQKQVSSIFQSVSPPTALALPLKMGFRHVPLGSSAARLPQPDGRAKGGWSL